MRLCLKAPLQAVQGHAAEGTPSASTPLLGIDPDLLGNHREDYRAQLSGRLPLRFVILHGFSKSPCWRRQTPVSGARRLGHAVGLVALRIPSGPERPDQNGPLYGGRSGPSFSLPNLCGRGQFSVPGHATADTLAVEDTPTEDIPLRASRWGHPLRHAIEATPRRVRRVGKPVRDAPFILSRNGRLKSRPGASAVRHPEALSRCE